MSEPELRAAFCHTGPDPRLVILPFGTPLDGQGVSVAMALRVARTTHTEGTLTPAETGRALGGCGLGALLAYIPFLGWVAAPAVVLLCMGGVVAVVEASGTNVVAENWEVTIRPGDLAPGVEYARAVLLAILGEAPNHRKVVVYLAEADLLVWLSTTPTLPAGIARAALQQRDWTIGADVGPTLARRDPFPLEFFNAMVDETSEGPRRAAITALGESRDGRVVAPLTRVLAADTSVSGELRVAAARSLGTLGDRQAFDPLIRALVDPATDVRDAAAAALGDLGAAAPSYR